MIKNSQTNNTASSSAIKINEIFFSIQGESSRTGVPTVFVRTTGCNLRCTYCDTTYSYYEGEILEIKEILRQIEAYPTKYVCVTGGEPLLQNSTLELMSKLCDQGYFVSLETSGSKSCEKVDPRVLLVIDVKTPESGAANSFLESNLSLRHEAEYKFVINSKSDFDWSENFCLRHLLYEKHIVLFSPNHGKVDPKWLSEQILNTKSKARLHLQVHKYIWPPDTRGV